MIRVLLVISDVAVKDSMIATLTEVGEVEPIVARSAEEAATALLIQPSFDAILVDEKVGRSDGLDVVRDLAGRAPLAGVLLLATKLEAHVLNEAMASGARSVIAKPFSVEEIWSTLDAVAVWSRTARSQVLSEGSYSGSSAGAGKVLAVTGAKGGTGSSVVAMLFAVATAENASVCIIDFDLQTGDLGPFSGVRTTRSVVDLVDISGELTGRALREMSYDLPEGMKLFPSPVLGERGEEMTGLATRNILSALRQQFDLIVVDCGARLDDAGAMVLELADVALLVATADIPALRSARTKLGLWERLNVRSGADTVLVINRASSKREVQADLATKVVGIEVIATIPEGGAAFESVMNTATLLTDRNTSVHQSVAELAAVVGRRWFGRGSRVATQDSGARWSIGRRGKPKAELATAPMTGAPQAQSWAPPVRQAQPPGQPQVQVQPFAQPQFAPQVQTQQQATPQVQAQQQATPQVQAQQQATPQVQAQQQATPQVQAQQQATPQVQAQQQATPQVQAQQQASPQVQPQPRHRPEVQPEPRPPEVHTAPGLARPPSYAPQPAQVAQTRRDARTADDSGQIAVQLPFVAGFMLILLLICTQMLLFGATHMVAQNGAGEAARWYGAGASQSVVQRDFKDSLPGLWQQGAKVKQVAGDMAVEVTIVTPRIVPGGNLDVTVRAAIFEEGR